MSQALPVQRLGSRLPTLRTVLTLDAMSCLLLGLGLTVFSASLSPLLGLPATLLQGAGLVLLPCAALMWIAARQTRPSPMLVWLIVLGNLAWSAASLWVAWIAFTPTALGLTFVLAQAAFVLAMAGLEWRGRARPR
ncbi:hypothetical protein M8A51_03955 [Schlegelella sp. S2-27]|uniref:Uncharacterized protein n=1 Tax=Caldimonas mangrovi TaxID=2944811 RepID=A0ABT0YJ07_9BURK|nr:hypothetical protein [Caldimonas mangrovi]MCM5678685.1 hypothetical protein [Caldimonas mangrovi]